MGDVDGLIVEIAAGLDEKNRVRDRALTDSRLTVRSAANAIRALHRGEKSHAREHLEAARATVAQTRSMLQNQADLYWAGYVQDAQKEVAEAFLVDAMIENRRLPEPSSIGVEPVAYLNGLAEAASEMRRYVLDLIRRGEHGWRAEAERILQLMDDVYSGLITVDFPDAVTGGLRRTTDQLRAVLERTRGDLTVSMRQEELERALKERADSGTGRHAQGVQDFPAG